MLFIIEAVALGYFLKYTKFNKWINTAVAILLLVAAIALGLNFPVYVDLGTWHIIIFVYILIASVAPVWALLQPRDYLNSYLLIFMIVGAVIGVFVANPACNLKPFTSFNVNGQYMFPILFVTIACGAVSVSILWYLPVLHLNRSKMKEHASGFVWRNADGEYACYHRTDCSCFLCRWRGSSTGTYHPAADFCRRDRKLSFRSWSAAFACIYINQPGGICICTDFLDSVARVGRLSFQEFFMDSDTDEENMSPFVKSSNQ